MTILTFVKYKEEILIRYREEGEVDKHLFNNDKFLYEEELEDLVYF